eukprot:TRINITY_DN52981_c0_g1_i1.p1 TRINITY_DN52981_c0_g1~~TRINITY_DN52981_c0_g1_i1.p1  ORF type:complete len:252 (+),score=49.34 TRINITY_DN52981_c0_g1_i1:40-756(+)
MAALLLTYLDALRDDCRLVLASTSPRRVEILGILGVPFEVQTPTFLEDLDKSRYTPDAYVVEKARIKCAEVSRRLHTSDDKKRLTIVVAADTVIVRDGCVLEKPRDPEHARQMLSRLSGRSHEVITGVAFGFGGSDDTTAFFETTTVRFRELSAAEIEAYVATGEPMDKAGAYGIQAKGALLASSIDGDYFNVVGFPLATFSEQLALVLPLELQLFNERQETKDANDVGKAEQNLSRT